MCVNPNFSNRIMGRVSEVMVRDLISAVDGGVIERKRIVMSETTVVIVVLSIFRMKNETLKKRFE